MDMQPVNSQDLAVAITRSASTQTHLTIRYLVDRDLRPDAYRAYAYFRWVDDRLDSETGTPQEKLSFLARQQSILDTCYRREQPEDLNAHEWMLVDLVSHDLEENSGLQSYLRNMMDVMAFDMKRRGRMITNAELTAYTQQLSTAVTDALFFFIGHNCPPPKGHLRYLAVRGAHIIHMLRDMVEDAAIGYFNIPRETLEAYDFSMQDVSHPGYCKWVQSRIELAALYFKLGREYIARVKSWRCRLAGYAYTARFEWMLYRVKRDGYRLRVDYPERKSFATALWMTLNTLASLLGLNRPVFKLQENTTHLFD